jgi:hypothetical protein
MSRRFARIKNTKHLTIRGYHNTLEDDGYELITTTGPAVPTLPTAVGVLSIVSSSASDTSGATKKVVIDYLDSTWSEKRAIFLINGTTAVIADEDAATINAIRVNRVWCNFANVGRIDVKIGSTTIQEVPIGQQTGGTFIYTVPLGQVAHIHGFRVSASQLTDLRIRAHLHGEGQVFRTVWTWTGSGSLYVPFTQGYPRRIETQDIDDAWSETKITLIADANCLTASVTDYVSLEMDLEVSRTDTTSPGFRTT